MHWSDHLVYPVKSSDSPHFRALPCRPLGFGFKPDKDYFLKDSASCNEWAKAKLTTQFCFRNDSFTDSSSTCSLDILVPMDHWNLVIGVVVKTPPRSI